jgi:hypothetical protein
MVTWEENFIMLCTYYSEIKIQIIKIKESNNKKGLKYKNNK